MKKKILSLIIVTLFLVIACKESITEQEPGLINDQYLLVKNGASFKYNLEISDSTGFTISGNRFMKFDDSTLIDGTNYYIQKDSFVTPITTQTSHSFVRKTNTGVFSYADTTGFTGFLPDSLRQYLTVDRESRLLFYPLNNGQLFPVFTLSLSQFIIGINVIDVDAMVESKDSFEITVNGALTQFSAFKIKYNFVIRTSSTNEIIYTAYGWAVKDLGFVKWDGDAEVFNFLLNENIFPPETNVKMDLISYQF